MTPARGFDAAEYRARLDRAQAMMAKADLAALFLTTEPEIRYFTGFLTRFWESPTRPWAVIVPVGADPVAVIPAIGANLMAQGWMREIRTWDAPDYADDGQSLMAETLREVVPKGGRIGVPSAMESHLRLPLATWQGLHAALPDRIFTDDALILRRLRVIKSDAEIVKIRHACGIADRAFARLGEIARPDVPLAEVFRNFQALLLQEGADWVSYLAGGAGAEGYGDVISPASETPLALGDVLMLDTGAVWDGYFCDFDRNVSIGPASLPVRDGYARLMEASAAGFAAARPGATAAELFHAMDGVLGRGAGAGRLGHGLGMQLTEWPSLIPADDTELAPGMVLTLEPGLTLPGGNILVQEEDIVITQTGATYLSTPAPQSLPDLLA